MPKLHKRRKNLIKKQKRNRIKVQPGALENFGGPNIYVANVIENNIFHR